jgi:[histone H3]-lysine4/36 N-trimethyltransferase SMYD
VSRDRFLDADVDGVTSAQWTLARHRQVDEAVAVVAAAANAPSRAEAITALTQALAVQDTVLHPDNIQRLATLSQLFTLQVQERSSLSDAVVTGEQILRVYKRVYSSHHAMVGLHLFTLGDLCAAEGSREKAREYLTAAHETLRVTHGMDHAFVGMAQQRLAELQSAVTQP